MRFFTIFSLFLLAWLHICAQESPYRRITIPATAENLQVVQHVGLHVQAVESGTLLLEIPDDDYKRLTKTGIACTIEISDLETFYAERNAEKMPDQILQQFRNNPDYGIPEGFSLGSMGGFCTYEEMLDHLADMSENYPGLISSIDSIPGGQTIEGRPVYWWKISDNANVNEQEPEVLFTALTHAREPGSMQQLLFFMYYLLENYASDPEIQQIVDETELCFVPCINPDGYLYNQTNFPQGGGMWRKNRRYNDNGSYGVDLNRNFGYQWGYNNSGSSPNSWSQTYRGTAPFSEPETQLIKSFCASHEFSVALNYHTYGNLLMHAWGYDDEILSPDHFILEEQARLMTSENHYDFGVPGALLYPVNGETNDWMYGDTNTKPPIYAFTPEVGTYSDGFWPDMERIIPQCIDCLHQNLTAARLAGFMMEIMSQDPVNITDHQGYLKFGYQRLGLDNRPFQIDILPLDDVFINLETGKFYEGSELIKIQIDSVAYLLKPGLLPGDSISYALRVSSGSYVFSDTVVRHFGQGNIAFADDCSTLDNWQVDSWIVSDEHFYSPDFSISNAQDSVYANSSNTMITITNPVDLTEVTAAWLSFYARWNLLGGKDFVVFGVSTDGGNSWTALDGRYTNRHFVPEQPELPVYCGYQEEWYNDWYDLSDFCGSEILLRFRFQSDEGRVDEGFYFDDFLIEILDESIDSLTITLHPGWNALSASIHQEQNLLDSLFAGFEPELSILQNENGFYQADNPASTILEWEWSSGYQAKVSDTISLMYTGYSEQAGFLELAEGWNLIPVYNEPVDPEDLYTTPSGQIEIIKEVIGTGIYWPAKNISSLGWLQPKKSYLVKMTGPGILFFHPE